MNVEDPYTTGVDNIDPRAGDQCLVITSVYGLWLQWEKNKKKERAEMGGNVAGEESKKE